MESLLPELAVSVAKFLTPRDLAACCGVSVHWREVFGSDQVWKRLCDLEMEEHLRTTPCFVQPVFSVSSEENSTLAPLNRWRLAFLREQHLWSNWRKGNYETLVHKVQEVNSFSASFITNDFIVSFDSELIHLWDVRPDSPIRVGSLDFNIWEHYTQNVFDNGLVVVKNSNQSAIKILKVDVIQGTILPGYQFLFNTITQTPQLVCSNTPVFNEKYSMLSFNVIVVKGRFCVGYFGFEADSNSFHIWDLESGIKLKQESLPINLLESGLSVVSSKTCDDLLVLVPCSADSHPSERPIASLQCRVYDVQNLCFLSFSQTCSVFPELLSGSMYDFEQCAIINNFVALTYCEGDYVKSIGIFNYRTDQQLCTLEANSCVQVLADECFVFTYQKYLPAEDFEEEEVRLCSVFCPSGEVVKDVTGSNVDEFDVVGDRLVEILTRHGDEIWDEIWGINRVASFKTLVDFSEHSKVNKACTKVVQYSIAEVTDTIRISHFW